MSDDKSIDYRLEHLERMLENYGYLSHFTFCLKDFDAYYQLVDFEVFLTKYIRMEGKKSLHEIAIQIKIATANDEIAYFLDTKGGLDLDKMKEIEQRIAAYLYIS